MVCVSISSDILMDKILTQADACGYVNPVGSFPQGILDGIFDFIDSINGGLLELTKRESHENCNYKSDNRCHD